jgi:uncharacterized membrane protein
VAHQAKTLTPLYSRAQFYCLTLEVLMLMRFSHEHCFSSIWVRNKDKPALVRQWILLGVSALSPFCTVVSDPWRMWMHIKEVLSHLIHTNSWARNAFEC